MVYISIKDDKCPFNCRDLKKYCCCAGNKKSDCRWFVKIKRGYIWCSHPKMEQQEFDFENKEEE